MENQKLYKTREREKSDGKSKLLEREGGRGEEEEEEEETKKKKERKKEK